MSLTGASVGQGTTGYALKETHQLIDTPVADSAVLDAVRTVRAPFERMKDAFLRDAPPSYSERRQRLDALLALVRDNQQAIEEAVSKDFGGRSRHETRIAEIFCCVSAIKYIRSNLRGWMKPQSRKVSLAFQPGRSKVIYQPRGVVGIIAPWNYPFQLAIEPAAYALAAGNRVLIKPSEFTPHTAELMKRLVAERFSPEVMDVVTGGAEVGEAFAHLPFDHLLFTGSTHVGRLVMKAAAENLVPVTLELGGKSPTLVHESFSVDRAGARIAAGKWFNAGQTCIAPDYVMVAEHRRDALVESIVAHTRKAYPTIKDNPDYTSVVSARHYGRLKGLVADAESRGAKRITVAPDGEQLPDDAHRLAPTILLDVNDGMRVMQEEIFGPVLPVMTYKSLEEAIRYVNEHPRPLALYYFDDDAERARDVLERTISGGACVNETMMHFAIDDIPFGGVGPSGLGAYHGIEGFETFSHKKGVFLQSRLNAAGLLAPPYGEKLNKLLKILIGK
jgi:acyl-CoA reductase-like NAD-dependent aldehyde dehydrogenase